MAEQFQIDSFGDTYEVAGPPRHIKEGEHFWADFANCVRQATEDSHTKHVPMRKSSASPVERHVHIEVEYLPVKGIRIWWPNTGMLVTGTLEREYYLVQARGIERCPDGTCAQRLSRLGYDIYKEALEQFVAAGVERFEHENRDNA